MLSSGNRLKFHCLELSCPTTTARNGLSCNWYYDIPFSWRWLCGLFYLLRAPSANRFSHFAVILPRRWNVVESLCSNVLEGKYVFRHLWRRFFMVHIVQGVDSEGFTRTVSCALVLWSGIQTQSNTFWTWFAVLQSVCAETFHTPSSELYPERTDDWGSVCVQSKIESSLFINCPDATITTIYWGCFKNYCGPFQDYKCCDFEVYVDWPMAYLRHAL
jgi:hypothetical protein